MSGENPLLRLNHVRFPIHLHDVPSIAPSCGGNFTELKFNHTSLPSFSTIPNNTPYVSSLTSMHISSFTSHSHFEPTLSLSIFPISGDDSSTGQAHIRVSLSDFDLEWIFYSSPHLGATILPIRSSNPPHAVFWLYLDYGNQNLTENWCSFLFQIPSFRVTCSSRAISAPRFLSWANNTRCPTFKSLRNLSRTVHEPMLSSSSCNESNVCFLNRHIRSGAQDPSIFTLVSRTNGPHVSLHALKISCSYPSLTLNEFFTRVSNRRWALSFSSASFKPTISSTPPWAHDLPFQITEEPSTWTKPSLKFILQRS